jgi:hypothetical protein
MFALTLRYLSLADFVAPREAGRDHLGMFVSSVFGCEELVAQYEAQNDDYNKILAQSLADRLAEAYAELLHRDIRTTHWGYAADEVRSRDWLRQPSRGGTMCLARGQGLGVQADHAAARFDVVADYGATNSHPPPRIALLPSPTRPWTCRAC